MEKRVACVNCGEEIGSDGLCKKCPPRRAPSLDEARRFWQVAGTFPVNKEEVYPGHAEAHEFDLQAGKRVLEYGCGGGSDTLSLLRRGAKVFFADIVPQNVALTMRRCREQFGGSGHFNGCELRASDAIPYFGFPWDTITSHGVLHHIPADDLERVLEQFYRVLKPGGHLYAMLYTELLYERFARRRMRLRAEGMTDEEAFGVCTDGGGSARAYSHNEGQALFERHGFTYVRAVEYGEGDFRTFKLRKSGPPTEVADE